MPVIFVHHGIRTLGLEMLWCVCDECEFLFYSFTRESNPCLQFLYSHLQGRSDRLSHESTFPTDFFTATTHTFVLPVLLRSILPYGFYSEKTCGHHQFRTRYSRFGRRTLLPLYHELLRGDHTLTFVTTTLT